jgi:hypothetical protein
MRPRRGLPLRVYSLTAREFAEYSLHRHWCEAMTEAWYAVSLVPWLAIGKA